MLEKTKASSIDILVARKRIKHWANMAPRKEETIVQDIRCAVGPELKEGWGEGEGEEEEEE
eukprot:789025-Prorocentrum_lima.AAC.1